MSATDDIWQIAPPETVAQVSGGDPLLIFNPAPLPDLSKVIIFSEDYDILRAPNGIETLYFVEGNDEFGQRMGLLKGNVGRSWGGNYPHGYAYNADDEARITYSNNVRLIEILGADEVDWLVDANEEIRQMFEAEEEEEEEQAAMATRCNGYLNTSIGEIEHNGFDPCPIHE